MRKKLFISTLLCLVLLAGAPLTQGAGFLIYEHGAAAMAMGGAFIGLANDPSAIFHNPAGIAWLEGTQISFGTTLITSSSSLSLPNWPDPAFQKYDQVKQLHYPPTFYITHKLSDKIVAGFGFFTPYGLGVKWPEDHPLKYIAISDDMKTFFFNPTLAFKVNDNFSVGFGVSYIYATLDFNLVEHADIDLGFIGLPTEASVDIPLVLEASGKGWCYNAGALYKGENFSIGFNWRGGFGKNGSFNIDFDGDLALGTPEVTIPSPYDQFVPPGTISQYIPSDGTAATSFNIPSIFGVGAAFNLTESLILTADLHYIIWSCYDEFVVEVGVDVPIPGVEFKDKLLEENWKDSFVVRGGLEYQLNESLALRAGILFDQTPQPVETMDPILPDANRWALTGGFGYKVGNFVLDLAYQYEIFSDRESPNRSILLHPLTETNLGLGTYSTKAHLFGISLGFVF